MSNRVCVALAFGKSLVYFLRRIGYLWWITVLIGGLSRICVSGSAVDDWEAFVDLFVWWVV